MVKSIIDNISLQPQQVIQTSGGEVLKIIDKDANNFYEFGEAYFSTIFPNKIKGWKKHKTMILNLVVPIGEVRFVFTDDGIHNFRTETIGDSNYCRITVPPNIWFAFQCVSTVKSFVLNISNIKHDPEEVEIRDLDYFNFKW